jgi:hypothetical protein
MSHSLFFKVPENLAKVSQQDTVFLADFLASFDREEENLSLGESDISKRGFLEDVGQYLR